MEQIMKMSRRRLLLNASSIVVFAGLCGSSSIADIYVPTDIEKKPEVSFRAAQSLNDQLVAQAVELSQKYAHWTYSPTEVSDIKNRIWDKTQLTMSQFYRPSEKN
jgi:hypothetical protein